MGMVTLWWLIGFMVPYQSVESYAPWGEQDVDDLFQGFTSKKNHRRKTELLVQMNLLEIVSLEARDVVLNIGKNKLRRQREGLE